MIRDKTLEEKGGREREREGKATHSILFPVRWQLLVQLVVTSETVDTRFDKNKTEFGILILATALQVLSDVHGLFDKKVQIFGNLWGKTYIRISRI